MTPPRRGYGAFDLTVSFGHHVALDRVTLAAKTGTVTAVAGGDGAGKSTLLRALVGRVPLSHGEVVVPPENDIGYQPAAAGSWADLTVAENVAFVGSTYGLSPPAVRARGDDLLGRAGLSQARDRLARQLSGGMRTKLGFCLAMLHEPSLLILDEPSTGVDPVSRVELWRLLAEAAAGGTTVIISTSYLDEAERAASVLVLEAGRALLAGPPDQVLADAPGVVVQTTAIRRPEYGWRHGRSFREWWPQLPAGATTVPNDLESVTIAASLRAAAGFAP